MLLVNKVPIIAEAMNDHLAPETTNRPYDVFLSHNSKDKPAVETLALRLADEARIKVWLDKWNLIPGEPWQEDLEDALDQSRTCAVFIGPSGLSPWHHEEMRAALQERVEQPGFRVIPVLLPGATMPERSQLPRFFRRLTWVDFQQGLDDAEAFRRLVAGIRGIAPGRTEDSSTPINDVECPYLGLEAFTEDKRHLFFGRDNFIESIWQKLQARQFVAVVGPSGSGKSSVVQAGVFPRLGGEWRKLVFQPGDDPFLNLADKFVEVRGARYRHFSERSKAVEVVAQQIRDSRSIAATVTETLAALPQPSHLLLVADQFEELFTLTPTADRQPFVEALLAAAHLAELKVLVTLRTDFFGQAISLTPELSQLIQDGMVTHRPLQRADWEAVILEPAKTVGLHVDPSLIVLILEEIEAQPDSLPLLEYTLKELWQHRAQGCIGLAQYEAIGKLAGAINQRADAVLAQLPAEQQPLALRALTRLVRVSGGEEEGADTRLRLPLKELTVEQRDVLQSFINERLLVTNRHDRTGEETIEVAHEALIRRWEKLRAALDDDREFLVWRRRLNVRRNLWEGKGCSDKWLLAGGEHDDAQRWLNERGMELNPAEIEFITWAERPEFQIERILAEAPSLLLFSDKEILQSWFRTLVFCGEQEKSLSSAREIEKADDRFGVLSDIVEALVKAELTTEALVAAREIENAHDHARALRFVTEALVKAGLIMEALVTTREIKWGSDRASALRDIAEALVKAGLTMEVLAAAREIEWADDRANALSFIAEALVKAGLSTDAREVAVEALAAAREIEWGADARASALRDITEVLVKVNLTSEVREVTAEVLAAAREIPLLFGRTSVLRDIAEALVKAGLTTEAREVATEALAAAREIEVDVIRTSALRDIAKLLVKAGLISEALAAAREIENPHDRTSALRDIAKALVKAGLTTEALATAREIEDAYYRAGVLRDIAEVLVKAGLTKEALAAAREIERTDDRAKVLSFIAEVLVKAGLTTEAWEVAAEALAAAREIYGADDRASALRDIAEVLVKAGLSTEAREVAVEALAAAREISKAYDNEIEWAEARANALSSIAKVLVKAGLSTEALAAAREGEEADVRARVLMSVADCWLEQRQIVQVESLLEEILNAISKIHSSDKRSSAERHAAVIFARLHRYHEARKFADLCHKEDRLVAYTTILREYHIERNPSLARLFAEEAAEAEKED